MDCSCRSCARPMELVPVGAEPMIVIAGLTMALMAVGAAFAIALAFPLSSFPELVVNCQMIELSEQACSAAAIRAGLYSIGSAIAVLSAAILMTWRTRR